MLSYCIKTQAIANYRILKLHKVGGNEVTADFAKTQLCNLWCSISKSYLDLTSNVISFNLSTAVQVRVHLESTGPNWSNICIFSQLSNQTRLLLILPSSYLHPSPYVLIQWPCCCVCNYQFFPIWGENVALQGKSSRGQMLIGKPA